MAPNMKIQQQAYTEPSDFSLEDQSVILRAKSMPWYQKLLRALHLTKNQGIYVATILFFLIGLAITRATLHPQGLPTKAGTNTVKISIQPTSAVMPPNTNFQVWETADKPVVFTTVRIVFNPKLVKMIREVSTNSSPLTRVIKKTAMSEANITGIINLTLALDPTKRSTPAAGTVELATIPLSPNIARQNTLTALHLDTSAMQVVNADATLFTITAVDSTITLNPPPAPTPTKSVPKYPPVKLISP